MKKRAFIATVLTVVTLGLVACGKDKPQNPTDNSSETEKVTNSNSSEQEPTQSGSDVTSDTEQLTKLGLLQRDGDKDHFKPATADYIYQIKYTSSDGTAQEAALYSFDGKGKLVQWAERKIDSYYLVNSEMDPYYAEKGAILDGDTLYYTDMGMQENLYGWSDKYGVLYDIARQDHSYYMSKALSKEQTELVNVYSESDFPEVAGANVQMLSDDYVIIRRNETYETSEHISQAFLGYDGQTPIEVPVRRYGAFSYVRTDITFYDSKGKELEDYLVIYAFEDADMIDSYFKHGYGSYFDDSSVDPSDQSVREADLSESAKEAKENSSLCKIVGRYLVLYGKNSEPEEKKYRDLTEEDRYVYYSKPYLTDSQISNDKWLQ